MSDAKIGEIEAKSRALEVVLRRIVGLAPVGKTNFAEYKENAHQALMLASNILVLTSDVITATAKGGK